MPTLAHDIASPATATGRERRPAAGAALRREASVVWASRRRFVAALALALGLCGGLPTPAQAQAQPDVRQANVELIRERLAHHVGTLAYLWGYATVDLSKQMHNQTHRVSPTQAAAAPVNHFYHHAELVTPATAGELRAPNTDTLYSRGWFDLTREPIVVQAPDTAGRYYTLAVTDFFNEVTHLGRRTTGTAARAFALVGPGWSGPLPEGVLPVPLATKQVWILGRLLVDGAEDEAKARALLRGFWAAPLSSWRRDMPPPVPAVPAGERFDPMRTLDFFVVLNRWLRSNAARADEGALVGLFEQIGIGPKSEFAIDRLDAATRRGLERAIADGQALLRASTQRPLADVRNGWIFPLALADYGHDYLMRAGVAFGGYANRPEETIYAARTVDDAGQRMVGSKRYRLRFSAESLPPANAFWSISAYDLTRFSLMGNPINRYSIGDRTKGLRTNSDGSLDILIQKDAPAEGHSNWLPVGEGAFSLILRIYEPRAEAFDGRYKPPPLVELR